MGNLIRVGCLDLSLKLRQGRQGDKGEKADYFLHIIADTSPER